MLSWVFFGPCQGWNQMGGLELGTKSDKRGLGKHMSAEVKNAPNSKIGANVCVLSIIKLSDAVMS